MKFTGVGLILMGLVIGAFYLIGTAAAPLPGGGGSVVMPVTAAAAALAGAAVLAYGGTGYRRTGDPTPTGPGSQGRAWWW